MPRKTKCRRVGHIPKSNFFKPSGIPAYDLEEIILKIEEAEALRLKDLMGLDQVDCAVEMGISRTTFQRILVEARQKVADALINSKMLVLEGGNYQLVVDFMAMMIFPCLASRVARIKLANPVIPL
jgi:predicted DNA-binding protein (UPF0251 family)